VGFRFHRAIWDVPRGFPNAEEDSKVVREVVPKLPHGIWAREHNGKYEYRYLILVISNAIAMDTRVPDILGYPYSYNIVKNRSLCCKC
jgi:hypothetical protein